MLHFCFSASHKNYWPNGICKENEVKIKYAQHESWLNYNIARKQAENYIQLLPILQIFRPMPQPERNVYTVAHIHRTH